MENERQEKIEALLSMDVQKLKLIKFGVPPVNRFYTVIDSGIYYNQAGKQVTRETMNKAKAKFPEGFIASVVVTYPLGTDMAVALKDKRTKAQALPNIQPTRKQI